MINRKKRLCIAMAVIMLMTVFSIPAVAGAQTGQLTKHDVQIVKERMEAKRLAATHQEKAEANASGKWFNVTGGQIYVANGVLIESDYETITAITEAQLKAAGVKRIKAESLAYCEKLKTVAIPETVTIIDPGAFQYNFVLKSFSVNALNPNYCAENGILFNIGKTELLQWPGGKVSSSYTIPSGVTKIKAYAFAGAFGIKSLTIPAGVTSIETEALDIWSLSSITVAAGNSKYASLNGVLYNKGRTTLLQYPVSKSGASFTIPSTVTTVGAGAFTYSRLKKLTISKNVVSIKANALVGLYDATAFIVSSANKKYSSVSGVLFTKDKKTLLLYPVNKAGAHYIVPSKTKTISANSIYTIRLKVIEIPSSVTSIKSLAIMNMDGITIVGSTSKAKNYAKHTGLPYVTKTAKTTKVKSTALKGKKIQLSWKKVSGAKGYQVYRATSKNGKYSKVKTITKGSTVKYTNSKLKKGKKYYYQVRAYKVVRSIKVYGSFSAKTYKKAK